MISTSTIIAFDRGMMGLALAVHIILVGLGLALPLVMIISEYLGIRKKDKTYLIFTKRISKVFLIFLALGTASGILVATNILVLWPKFMALTDQVAALPFYLETLAFFLESLFVVIYFISWKKLEGSYKHVLLGIPIVIGGALSAVFITMINAFMNTPTGFDIKTYLATGAVTNIHPWAVFTTSTVASEVPHVLVGTYLLGIFLIIIYFSIMLLKRKTEKEKQYYKKILAILIILAIILTALSLISGDHSARDLYNHQPKKYAAIEGNLNPMTYASEKVGGSPLKYFEIPYIQSILATGKPSGEVPGLSSYNPEETPPLWIHLLFDIMVFGGIFIALVLIIIIILYWRKKNPLSKKIILWLLTISGFITLIVYEGGWVMAEVGRQPWIINNVMKVSEAANMSPGVIPIGIIIAIFYIIVLPISVIIIRMVFKNKPLKKELKETEK